MQIDEVTAMAVDVMDKQTELYRAQEADTAAVYALEDAKAQAISEGAINGKNAEEREAKAAQILADQIGAQRVTKAKVAYAKMQLDRAVMNWERVKYTIRLLEVNKAQA
jgi:hypothetical protein